MRRSTFDKPLALILGALILFGALVFSSAVFGLFGRGETHAPAVAFNHLVLGLGLGLCGLLVAALTDYRLLRRWAPHLFVGSLLFTALVFIPFFGFSHGGGQRWLNLFGFSFQPSETIKIASVLMLAAYFSATKDRARSMQGLIAFLAILAIPALLLILQPDLGTLGIIVFSSLAVFIAAGARVRDIGVIILLGLLALGVLAFFRPYVLDRITTFISPHENVLVEGYQINQSLIAIGSGGVFGRGFGQGVQKFTYLPEPMGDSIFAVAAEETGFIGASLMVLLFLALALRGLAVAARAPDLFGALSAVGISAYLSGEAFINIAAITGLAPLTGVPLTFVSQGGSAMLVSLTTAGILLSISRRSKKV